MAANQLEKNKEEFFFEGKNLKCKKELLGGFGFVYGGYWYDKELDFSQGLGGKSKIVKKEAIIRRILKTDCLDDWGNVAKKLTQSNSKNKKNFDPKIVLQIFAYEDAKDDWRYFAVEPYSSTLYHYCNGQYQGPALPSKPQVINQIISGIKHLHDMEYVHGDLNPLNVIITQDKRIKLSDFGLSKFSYTKCPSDDGIIPDICKRKYWRKLNSLVDETLHDLISDPNENIYSTEEDDIFAAGCLIFYFLTNGVHPFGNDPESIEENMMENNPINLEKLDEEDAVKYTDPIQNMVKQSKDKPKHIWWRKAIDKFEDALLLKIDKNSVLGKGSYGKVYEGKYEGVPVAVKQIKKTSDKYLIDREMEHHIKLDHDNVLKLLKILPSDDDCLHLVLVLCAGTLTDYCEKKKGIPQLPTDGDVLYQIANGVNYIHSRNLVHRDIKPDNILISITQPVQMKVADLGLVKQITDEGCYSLSAVRGTPLYRAPELLEKSESWIRSDETIQTDIFSTGCVFFYFLTRGFHPFHDGQKVDNGNWPQVKEKMIKNEPIGLESRKNSLSSPFDDLISKMIAPKANRIELPEVIKKLATELSATRGFKEVVNPIVSECWTFCFHPTEPVLACGDKKLLFLSAANSSIPFSNWKEKSETKIQRGNLFRILYLKWNVDGTQLAVVGRDSRDVLVKVLSYPSCEILFEKHFPGVFISTLEWNHLSNVLAVPKVGRNVEKMRLEEVVFLFHFDDKQKCQSYAIKQEKTRTEWPLNVQWISKNQIALGLENGPVEIYEMDESDFVFRLFKRYDHFKLILARPFLPTFVWDERTKCFAALCDAGKSLKIWPMEGDKPIYSLEIDEIIRSFAWRPNGKKRDDEEMDAARKSSSNFILACGFRKGILIWSPVEEKQKKILNGHSLKVHFLSFSPDGKFLASGDGYHSLIIWSTETWNPVFIGKKDISPRFSSWMASSADNPEYKFICRGIFSSVLAVEYAVGQTATSVKGSENIPSEEEDRQSEKRETRGEYSIGSSEDLK